MGAFSPLGLEVAVTELDVRVQLPSNETFLALQAKVYKNVRSQPFMPPPWDISIGWELSFLAFLLVFHSQTALSCVQAAR